MRKIILASLVSAAALVATPASAAVISYQLKITGDNSGTGADTPTFLLTNSSTFSGSATGADALSAYLTSFKLSFVSTSFIDRLTNFTAPTPPAQTSPAISYDVAYPDSSSNNSGTQGFLVNFGGFNAGDAFQFAADFDLPGSSANANYRSILEGSTIGLTFADGTTQSLTLTGFNAATSTYNFTGTNSAVPEPATWAMMIGGFGMVGGAMRTANRRTKLALAKA